MFVWSLSALQSLQLQVPEQLQLLGRNLAENSPTGLDLQAWKHGLTDTFACIYMYIYIYGTPPSRTPSPFPSLCGQVLSQNLPISLLSGAVPRPSHLFAVRCCPKTFPSLCCQVLFHQKTKINKKSQNKTKFLRTSPPNRKKHKKNKNKI